MRVYKAAHHGSNANDSSAFLAQLKPLDVAIGVGAGNPYGHPGANALGVYASIGASIWRTDLNGEVVFSAESTGAYSVTGATGPVQQRTASLGCTRTTTGQPPVISPPAPPPSPPPTGGCCRICRTGKPCGDTCIARNKTCRVGPGCACAGSVPLEPAAVSFFGGANAVPGCNAGGSFPEGALAVSVPAERTEPAFDARIVGTRP